MVFFTDLGIFWVDVINEVFGRLTREMRSLGMGTVITRFGMSTMSRSPMVLVSIYLFSICFVLLY